MDARVARGEIGKNDEKRARGDPLLQEIDFRLSYMGTRYVVESPSILHKQGKVTDLLILYLLPP